MQPTQVLGAQISWFRAFPQVSEFLPYPTRAAHGRNPRRNPRSFLSRVAGWPPCLSEDSRRRPRSAELVRLGPGADAALQLVHRAAEPATGPPLRIALRRCVAGGARRQLAIPDAIELATRPTTPPARRSAFLWNLFSPGAHGRQDQPTTAREDQMIRILHRILDIAAAAGNVAVTAHPAAALAHLGHPRASRPTRRSRWRSATAQRVHAPERLTWLEWSRAAGSTPASSGDKTLRPGESRVPHVRGMSPSQTHPVR